MSFSLNEIFSDNTVFAHGKPITVYGSGDGHISVTLNGVSRSTECVNGKWSLTLPPMEIGGPYTMTAEQGTVKTVLKNIHVGEVILILGQSNMQMKLKETEFPQRSYKSCEKLRLFTVDRIEDTEHFHSKDGWVKCDKKTAGEWTAIGYHIGYEVSKGNDVAVGIIACYQGASMIQSWLPTSVKEKYPEAYILPENRHSDYKDFPLWNKDGVLYEAMLKKIIPFSLNRVVYYQGESNTTLEEGNVYDKLLIALINTLREDFSDPNLPITVVQIADLDDRNDDAWRSVQQAQLRVTHKTDDVRTVISADISQTHTIHPTVKYPLAKRIVESFS